MKLILAFVTAAALLAPLAQAEPRTGCKFSYNQITDALQPISVRIGVPFNNPDNRLGPIMYQYQRINRLSAFEGCGLNLGPNELRHVHKVSELVQIVAWGLRNPR